MYIIVYIEYNTYIHNDIYIYIYIYILGDTNIMLYV